MSVQAKSDGTGNTVTVMSGLRTVMAAVLRDREGNVLIITTLSIAVIALLLGFLIDAGTAWSYRSEAKRNMALSCERGIKPTRTLIPDDQDRRERILAAFDELSKPGTQTVVARNAQVNWLNANLTASFSYLPPFRRLFGYGSIAYNLSANCQGIPPYPRDGETVLSSAFTKPDGTDIKLFYGQTSLTPDGCWDVYSHTSIGWDNGTGTGIEIQDWSNPYCRDWFAWVGLPPADFPNRYAMELDSWFNSSISKKLELHPGRYKISVWYNGRNNDLEGSNEISVSLQKLMPSQEPEQRIITMAQGSGRVKWDYYSYDITVNEYSLYDLKIAAGGRSDGRGGIISSFQVQYIDSL